MNFGHNSNFDKKKRLNRQIKLIVFHYTGMQCEVVAIKRLVDNLSKVSCHYFIDEIGNITKIVPEKFSAWHAGKSSWKNFKFLNKFSIGIELVNPGHDFGYRKFSKKQIHSLKKISKKLIAKYNIIDSNIVGHSDVSPLRKKDPGEKFPWKTLYKNKIGIWHNLKKVKLSSTREEAVSIKKVNLFMKNLSKFGYPGKSIIVKNKRKYNKLLVKAFQRRFRPELINGIIDRECLLISQNLIKS